MLQTAQSAQLDCYHCGLPVSTGEQFSTNLDGVRQYFCCPACQSIATTIFDNGLGSFYQFQNHSQQAASLQRVEETFSAFDDPEFQQRFVSYSGTKDKPIAHCELLIGEMHCAACVWLLEKYLNEMPGINKVSVSLSEQKASVSWQLGALSLSNICQSIAKLGYAPEPYSAEDLAELQRRENHQALRRLGVAGIAMMQVGMFAIALYAGALQGIAQEYKDFMRWVSLLVATPVVLYSAKPFFVGAWRGLVLKKPGMDLPIAIAIGLAYLASLRATMTGLGEVYFDSVTMFTFFLLAGRYLEMRARHFGGRLSNNVASLLPSTAIRLSGSESGVVEQQVVPLFKINRDDQLLVKAGQVIPVDGVVVSGDSHVNEAHLTGEFIPQEKTQGDHVVAGSVNGEGVLTILVESTGADLQLQSINELLARAQAEKPKIAQLADRFASYFIVTVLALAVATYCYWRFFGAGTHSDDAFWIMLSVLVVSCPCALSLATPATITAATNRLRGMGILVTDPQVWEKIPEITHVVCDKTGTLTKGELSLTKVLPVTDIPEKECLDIAAALESFSEHPIAKAFTSNVGLITSNLEVVTGQGLQGVVSGKLYRIGRCEYVSELFPEVVATAPDAGQWVLLGDERGPVCWLGLQDTLRNDAAVFVSGLRKANFQIHLLSGDSSGAAETLSKQLKLDVCVAGATPQQKLHYIRTLQQNGAKVLMLGDGINDIPVLAAADVSVAMVNASNLAKANADGILLSGQLQAVLDLMSLAKRARYKIRQNLAWALSYNTLALPLAAMAMVPPYLAAIGMSLSSLVVVVNALYLQGGELHSNHQNKLSGTEHS